MNKPQLNLQDTFLNQARKDNVGVTIYLVNSIKLQGLVRGFDAFTILLESPGKPPQLVYKHSITSIVPARPIHHILTDALREAGLTQPNGVGTAPQVPPVAATTHPDPADAMATPRPHSLADTPRADLEPIS